MIVLGMQAFKVGVRETKTSLVLAMWLIFLRNSLVDLEIAGEPDQGVAPISVMI
jgi:hypothetical protein